MARDRGGHQVDHRHGLRVRLNELTAVDGPFLAWADVSTPPLAAQRPWSLDGAFHFDGECFEINPVMGYTLATRGVAVRGPAAAELGVVTDATDRRTWVRENVDTYWPAVLGQVRHAVESDPERSEFDPRHARVVCPGHRPHGRHVRDLRRGLEVGRTGVADRTPPGHADVLRTALAIRREPVAAPVDRAAVTDLIALLDDQVLHVTTA